jgi:hypothetical protein
MLYCRRRTPILHHSYLQQSPILNQRGDVVCRFFANPVRRSFRKLVLDVGLQHYLALR